MSFVPQRLSDPESSLLNDIRYLKVLYNLDIYLCVSSGLQYFSFDPSWYYRDEDNDLEEDENSDQHKEGLKRVTFALPDDEAEDTSPIAAKQESDEVKSSFEKRQEKVVIRNIVYLTWQKLKQLTYSFKGKDLAP